MLFYFTPSYFIPLPESTSPHVEEQLRDEGLLGSLFVVLFSTAGVGGIGEFFGSAVEARAGGTGSILRRAQGKDRISGFWYCLVESVRTTVGIL
jgi:hypothetical protein